MEQNKEKAPSNSGLGFIDLLAITLVVVILQTMAIIDRSDNVIPPQPTTYIVSVYQPPETAGGAASDHLAFVRIGKHLLFWNNSSLPKRFFPAPSLAAKWREVAHFGQSNPPSTFYRAEKGDAAITEFVLAVKEDIGTDVTITQIENRPTRITLNFDDTVDAFDIEVAHNICFASNVQQNKYLGKYLHPVMVKWSILGREPVVGSGSPREFSRHNANEWADGGQFSISKLENNCDGKTVFKCAVLTRQSSSFVSTKVDFTGASLQITDGHGVAHNAR